jgi:hypothetical protein
MMRYKVGDVVTFQFGRIPASKENQALAAKRGMDVAFNPPKIDDWQPLYVTAKIDSIQDGCYIIDNYFIPENAVL